MPEIVFVHFLIYGPALSSLGTRQLRCYENWAARTHGLERWQRDERTVLRCDESSDAPSTVDAVVVNFSGSDATRWTLSYSPLRRYEINCHVNDIPPSVATDSRHQLTRVAHW